MKERSPTKEVVRNICKMLRDERPDYIYLRDLFKKIRNELNIEVMREAKRLPYVPTEKELKRYYHAVLQSRNIKHMVLIKVLLYTGIRVQELVNIKIADIDFNYCQLLIKQAGDNKDRIVPFPRSFREELMLFANTEQMRGAVYLFESNRKKAFTTRGIRKILADYAIEAGMKQSISPRKLRHFLFTWLKRQGINDTLIQAYSGHKTHQALDIYSKLSLTEVQKIYDDKINQFPIK